MLISGSLSFPDHYPGVLEIKELFLIYISEKIDKAERNHGIDT